METAAPAPCQSRLPCLQPVEQIDASALEPPVFGARKRDEGVGAATPMAAPARSRRAAIGNAGEALVKHGLVHQDAAHVDDVPAAHSPQEPAIPVGRLTLRRLRPVGT